MNLGRLWRWCWLLVAGCSVKTAAGTWSVAYTNSTSTHKCARERPATDTNVNSDSTATADTSWHGPLKSQVPRVRCICIASHKARTGAKHQTHSRHPGPTKDAWRPSPLPMELPLLRPATDTRISTPHRQHPCCVLHSSEPVEAYRHGDIRLALQQAARSVKFKLCGAAATASRWQPPIHESK